MYLRLYQILDYSIVSLPLIFFWLKYAVLAIANIINCILY